jgi:hypothetical protein
MLTAGAVLLAFSIWLLCAFGLHPGVVQTLWRWSGDDLTNRWDAFLGASKDSYSSLISLVGETLPFPQQFQLTQMGCVIWERAGGNILELESLHAIWKIEEKMRAHPGWTDHCFYVPLERLPPFLQNIVIGVIDGMKDQLSGLETETNCIAFKSIFTELKEFMNSSWGIPNAGPDDLTDGIIQDFLGSNKTRQHRLANVYLGTDFNADTVVSSRLRSMFPFALPLKGYRNRADRTEEQMGLLSKWVMDFIQPAMDTQKTKPFGLSAYSANPFALDLMIRSLVAQHLGFIAGAVVVVGLLTLAVTRSKLIASAGTIGIVFCIPCAIITQQGIIGIKYWDGANVISLFVIIGIGAGAQFIAFELFKAFRAFGNTKRIALTAQRSLLIIGTPSLVSAVIYLALLSSGVRIMGFIGVFFVLLLFYSMFFLFTWTIPVLALWAKWFEPVDTQFDRDDRRILRSSSMLSIQTRSRSYSHSQDPSEDDDPDETEPVYDPIDYPYTELLGFTQKHPVFNVDGAGGDTSQHNFIQSGFYRYLTPAVYFYRLPIVLAFLVLAAGLAVRAFRFSTKSGFQFLSDFHPVQRGFTLYLYGFANPGVDQEFVYMWGIDPAPSVRLSDRLTVDSYGSPSYNPVNVTDPAFQTLINNLYSHLLNQSFIDCPDGTDQFGVNPWSEWSLVFGLGDSWAGWLFQKLIEQLGLAELPSQFPVMTDQWSTWGWLFQLLSGKLSYEEPENFFKGMMKANCIGFSRFDYHLQYIGVKAPWRMPTDHVLNHDVYRRFYDIAVSLDAEIRQNASLLGVDVEGWFTGASYIDMITQEKLPRQVLIGSAIGLGAAAVVLLLCTWSIRYTFVLTVTMVVLHFSVLGIFASVGWRIGCNETVMFTVITAVVAQFLIVPTVSIVSDTSGRSLFGKLQYSITTFSAPTLYTLCATVASCAFMFPCDIILLHPFATLQLTSVAFSLLLGLFAIPAALGIIYRRSGPPTAREPMLRPDAVLAK